MEMIKTLVPYMGMPFVVMQGSLQLLSLVTKPFVEYEVGEVSEIYIHPIRAMRPVKVPHWSIEIYGLFMDKRMCLLEEDGLRLKHTKPGSEVLQHVSVSLPPPYDKVILSYKGKPDLVIHCSDLEKLTETEVDEKGSLYSHVGDIPSGWIADILGRKIRLMFSPYKSSEGADNIPPSLDPVHILGEASRLDFSSVLGWDVEMERFRPNIVSTKHPAYDDEHWDEIRIGEAILTFNHRTTRCYITDVMHGVRAPDTLEGLKKHRPRCEVSNKAVMGTYFKVKKPGVIKVSDKIILVKRR